MKKIIIREDFEGFDVHKKFNIIVDVSYNGNNFELGGKLSAVFGQYGVTDNESFIENINHVFNSILIDLDEEDLSGEKKYNFIFNGFNKSLIKKYQEAEYLEKNIEDALVGEDYDEDSDDNLDGDYDEDSDDNLDEDSDEDSDEDFIEEFVEHSDSENDDEANILGDDKDVDQELIKKNFLEDVSKFNSLAESFENEPISVELKNISAEKLFKNEDKLPYCDPINFDKNLLKIGYLDDRTDEVFTEENSVISNNNDDDDIITFFVPVILICYRKEKKADFFIFNPFYKRSFVNLWKLNTLSYFAIMNNYEDFFFNLKNFYSIKKYMLHIHVFNKYFFNFNFLSSISKFSQIPITDKIFEAYYDYDFNMHFFYRKKVVLRRRTFRSYYLRKKKQISVFLKSFKWFSYEILFKFFVFKYAFFDLEINYNELKKKILTLYSIMRAFKKKFARKYRRRKSFKRLVFRNRVGVKMSFIRQQFFAKKKKKK